MERTDKQKEQILKYLWYSRNPCHDKDQEGNDRFWGTALCVFNDYQKALTIPVVVLQSEQFSLSDIYKIAQNYTEEQFVEMVKHLQG